MSVIHRFFICIKHHMIERKAHRYRFAVKAFWHLPRDRVRTCQMAKYASNLAENMTGPLSLEESVNLIERSATGDAFARLSIMAKEIDKDLLLQVAVVLCNTDITKRLLLLGANPNRRDYWGNTAVGYFEMMSCRFERNDENIASAIQDYIL